MLHNGDNRRLLKFTGGEDTQPKFDALGGRNHETISFRSAVAADASCSFMVARPNRSPYRFRNGLRQTGSGGAGNRVRTDQDAEGRRGAPYEEELPKTGCGATEERPQEAEEKEAPIFKDILFEFDSYSVRTETIPVLQGYRGVAQRKSRP